MVQVLTVTPSVLPSSTVYSLYYHKNIYGTIDLKMAKTTVIQPWKVGVAKIRGAARRWGGGRARTNPESAPDLPPTLPNCC